MGNMVISIYVKFNYDWLHIDEALGNWKSEQEQQQEYRSYCLGTLSGSNENLPIAAIDEWIRMLPWVFMAGAKCRQSNWQHAASKTTAFFVHF